MSEWVTLSSDGAATSPHSAVWLPEERSKPVTPVLSSPEAKILPLLVEEGGGGRGGRSHVRDLSLTATYIRPVILKAESG